jgi:hypothetical protein
MTEILGRRVRYKLELAKLRVIKVEPIPGGFRFAIDMLNGVKLICDVPIHADVKEGDLLTLYTEILANAQPSPTSIQ